MRGTRPHEEHHRRPHRIIPARAGNARPSRPARCHPADHPRACGERTSSQCRERRSPGSSPRVRGTLGYATFACCTLRIIPARAGNAGVVDDQPGAHADHPRACGERSGASFRTRGRSGSSPRVRGTLSGWTDSPAATRIIPARAGNAAGVGNSDFSRSDHPRACGERDFLRPGVRPRSGSSPRVRGTPVGPDPNVRVTRIIPARAGNAKLPSMDVYPPPDHPRACGERRRARTPILAWSGSSPRVRGTRGVLLHEREIHRIIPARAGNAIIHHSGIYELPDHPRACGERLKKQREPTGYTGSSPRVRGTPEGDEARHQHERIIPARAGNASTVRRRNSGMLDHPRACGERSWIMRSASSRTGSSPRVRGTRQKGLCEEVARRIIPARAGNAS